MHVLRVLRDDKRVVVQVALVKVDVGQRDAVQHRQQIVEVDVFGVLKSLQVEGAAKASIGSNKGYDGR